MIALLRLLWRLLLALFARPEEPPEEPVVVTYQDEDVTYQGEVISR